MYGSEPLNPIQTRPGIKKADWPFLAVVRATETGKIQEVMKGPNGKNLWTPHFAVAAIPVKYRGSRLKEITDKDPVGFVTRDEWQSDSMALGYGSINDLTEVKISEMTQARNQRGTFGDQSGFQGKYDPDFSGYRPGTGNIEDNFTIAKARIKLLNPLDGPPALSGAVLSQVSVFLENRTGAIDIPMPNSGYTLFWVVKKNKRGLPALFYRRYGDNASAKGFSSDRGATIPANGISNWDTNGLSR
jgi:hypothetical protein